MCFGLIHTMVGGGGPAVKKIGMRISEFLHNLSSFLIPIIGLYLAGRDGGVRLLATVFHKIQLPK